MDHDFDEGSVYLLPSSDSERLIMDRHDLGVIFIFDNEDALRKSYSPHKAHLDYQEYTAPYIQGRSPVLPAVLVSR